MQCNIDQRGRKARLIGGIIVGALGVVLLVLGILRDDTAHLVAGGIVILAGVFMIFEGLKGWCALRAMGVKTPL